MIFHIQVDVASHGSLSVGYSNRPQYQPSHLFDHVSEHRVMTGLERE